MNTETGHTQQETRVATRYVWETGIGILAFLLLFMLLPGLWKAEPGTWQHWLQTLLPILPLIWIVVAIWRHFRRMDEMQRAVFARSAGFAFAVAMLAAVTVGLLQGRDIEVPIAEWVVFISGMAAWGLALPVNFARINR